ncbi:MAG: peptidyl-prolyl cis-trans isomerase [Desulfatiglandales bacterium]
MDQMPYDINLTTYADQHGMTVKETDYFPKTGAIPGLGEDERLTQSIYSLENGEISEVIKHKDKFYIIQVVDTKDSHIPEMSEVSDQLERDFINHLSLIAAKKEAKSYLEQLKRGANWSELAKSKGLETEETDFFTRKQNPPKIDNSPLLSEAAFSLSSQKIYPDEVFEINNKIYVIRWLSKEDIDTTDFHKEKESFKQAVLLEKEKRIFNAWLQSLKEKAEIKIVTHIE